MSAYEQRIEPPDRRWQYLLMAAEPYETIAFKVRSWEFNCCVCDNQVLQYNDVNHLVLLGS